MSTPSRTSFLEALIRHVPADPSPPASLRALLACLVAALSLDVGMGLHFMAGSSPQAALAGALLAGALAAGAGSRALRGCVRRARATRLLAEALLRLDSDCLKIVSVEGRLMEMSPAGQRLMEVDDFDAVRGADWLSFWKGEEAVKSREAFAQAKQGEIARFEAFCPTMAGTPKWWSVGLAPVLDDAGRVLAIVCPSIDVTETRATRKALEQRETMFREMAECMPSIFWVLRPDLESMEYLSPAFEQLFGIPRAEFERDPRIWHEPIDEEGRAVTEALFAKVQAGASGALEPIEYRIDRRDGTSRWIRVMAYAVRDAQGALVRLIGAATDISAERGTLERLHRQANIDSLTTLPNRRALLARLDELCTQPAGERAAAFALLFVDLDHFKVINDTRGHGFGDEVLAAIGLRIQNVLGAEAFVARLGGDEFAALLPGDTSAAEVSIKASALLESLGEPLAIGGSELLVTASIGIALYPEHAQDPAALLRYADLAMYDAKRSSRNAWRLHSAEHASTMLGRFELEQELRRALEQDEFALVYQPRFDAGGQRMVGAEALLRWRHPVRGLVSPAEFIPVLEDTGLIEPAGRWVVEEALRQLVAWEAVGARDFTLSVNVSARQLRSDDLVRWLEEHLPACALRNTAFELELTESVLMEDPVRGRAYIDRVRALGVGISIDDFGTGYSSLSYLKRFAPDVLKLDRSLVQDIYCNEVDQAIVSGTIGIAHSLGIRIVAEGVERAEQLAALQRIGCDEVQGFLFAKPMGASELGRLADWQRQSSLA